MRGRIVPGARFERSARRRSTFLPLAAGFSASARDAREAAKGEPPSRGRTGAPGAARARFAGAPALRCGRSARGVRQPRAGGGGRALALVCEAHTNALTCAQGSGERVSALPAARPCRPGAPDITPASAGVSRTVCEAAAQDAQRAKRIAQKPALC